MSNIPLFKENGYLPEGYHKCKLNDLEDRFSSNLSKRRKEIMRVYKIHLKEIINTNLVIGHWVDGTFTTDKRDPGDIDLLTEFDGVKTDELGMKDEIDNIICTAQERFDNLCDSHRIFKYPEDSGKPYKSYIRAKTKYLGLLFNSDREYNIKGVLSLEIDDLGGEL